MYSKNMKIINLVNLEAFHHLFRAFRSHDGFGYWFRGQSDASWCLLPKAGRQDYYLPSNKDLGRFNDWSNHAVAYHTPPDSKIESLAIAQHHGLATRLLDWTKNPLVAAFFCCLENQDIEGAIYVLEIPKMLITEQTSIESLKTYSGVVGYIPNSISPRVLNQRGLFTVHCDAKCEIEITPSLIGNDEPNLNKIIIGAELKREILQMLDDYGINRAVLFPGLDGLSSHINHKTESLHKETYQKV
jgi:hypothetical protein